MFLLGTALAPLTPPVHAADGHAARNPAAQDAKKFQLRPGLRLDVVATEPQLENPVAFSIDGRGTFYIAETHRYRDAIFDITANTPWLLDDLSFRTVNDRAAFLARTFATNFAILTNRSELIRRVEDRDGDGVAETSSVFADGFREPEAGTAAGVLAQGPDVWFTSIPGLWHFTAGATQPAALSRQRLADGLGVHISVSGHDVHGLIRGPDGRIYFSFGDRGVCVTNREGRVLDVADTGGVLRCEPDGHDLEIFCVGLRNPQELAFDDLGNLWTVDNDTAGADPCRVLHLLEGADYGWRASYQHMKGFGPWVHEELWRGGLDGQPPLAGTVSQGPSGLAFHPGPGTSLVPSLAGRFVHADFPGGIWAYDVVPRGASYRVGQREKIVWNCWATDVDFGPDGALYVLDWVQGWTPPGKGRIYRLTETNLPSSATVNAAESAGATRRLLAEGMTNRAAAALLPLLGHPDRRVRLEAQWELARRGPTVIPALTTIAASTEEGVPQLARIHALWALRHLIRLTTESAAAGARALDTVAGLLTHRDEELRGQAALALAARLDPADGPRLALLLDDPSPRTRLLGLEALAAHARRGLTPPEPLPGIAAAIHRAVTNAPDDAFLATAALGWLSGPNAADARAAFSRVAPAPLSPDAAIALVRAARRSRDAGAPEVVTSALSHPSPRVVLEAVRAIHDTPLPEAYPALAGLLEDPRFRSDRWGDGVLAGLSNVSPAGPFTAAARPAREQVLRRALSAHFRLGQAPHAAALVRFAGESAWPAALQAEALALLGAWEVRPGQPGHLPFKPAKDPNHGSVPTVNPENWPGWFDRVVGLWRPLPPRPADAASAALSPIIARLVADAAPEVALAAVDAAVSLRLAGAAPALLARLPDRSTPTAIRTRIPGALAALDVARLRSAIPIALADTNTALRAAVLPFLDRLEGNAALETLQPIVRRGTNVAAMPLSDQRLAQAALGALGRLRSPGVEALLLELLAHRAAGRYPATLELDLVEAAREQSTPALTSALARHADRGPQDDPLARWRTTLAGGDAERGRTVFLEKVEVQCSRCHQVKKEGGIVGPALDGIGSRQNRAYLLESIVLPNRVIAPGFENVILTMRNGTEHAGVVKAETPDSLRLDSPEDGPLTLAKKDIAERRRSLSAMPEGLADVLSPRELRDLIEFLAGLK